MPGGLILQGGRSSQFQPSLVTSPWLCHSEALLARSSGRCQPEARRHRCSAQRVAAVHSDDAGSMRRLVMMRHADSERPLLSQDHARPITEDGRQDAQSVAKKLHERGWLPQLIMCSSATRTLQTLESMRDAVAALGRVEIHSRGSLFTVAALDGVTLQHLQEIVGDIVGQAHVACLMCMGHNKGWEEVASILAGRQIKLGTSHAALFEGRASSWESAFGPDTKWRLVDLITPEPQQQGNSKRAPNGGSDSPPNPLPQPS